MYLLQCTLVYCDGQFVLPQSLEKHRSIYDECHVKHFLEETLELEDSLLIDHYHLLVCKVLQLCSFKVNDGDHLVHTFFVYELLAVGELDSPCVLQFLDEEMYEQIH